MGHLKTLQDGLQKDGKTDVFPLLFGAKRPAHSNRHQPDRLGQGRRGRQGHAELRRPGDDRGHRDAARADYEKKYVTDGAVGYEYPDVLTGFQTGKAVTAFQWNAAAPTFLDASKSPETAGKLGFSTLPYFKDEGSKLARFNPSPHGIGVSAYSKNQKEAFAYCAWFTSQEIARDYVVNGGGSSGRGIAADGQGDPREEPAVSWRSTRCSSSSTRTRRWSSTTTSANTILASHTSAIWTKQETPRTGWPRRPRPRRSSTSRSRASRCSARGESAQSEVVADSGARPSALAGAAHSPGGDPCRSRNRSHGLRRARRRGWSLPDRWLAHLLLWPALLALALVFAYPLIYSFWISLHVYNITRPPVFVGLDNYMLIVQDMRVWESFGVSVTSPSSRCHSSS